MYRRTLGLQKRSGWEIFNILSSINKQIFHYASNNDRMEILATNCEANRPLQTILIQNVEKLFQGVYRRGLSESNKVGLVL